MKWSRAVRVRRTVSLQRKLVEEVRRLAPHELRDNLNRLVVVSLEEFVPHRRAAAFEMAMVRMARDPAIRQESGEIGGEFESAAFDGLRDD
jgi:hypothetical protein